MPQIFIVRKSSSLGSSPGVPAFEILLQRRSKSVEEGVNWGLPGGRFQEDESLACTEAKVSMFIVNFK